MDRSGFIASFFRVGADVDQLRNTKRKRAKKKQPPETMVADGTDVRIAGPDYNEGD